MTSEASVVGSSPTLVTIIGVLSNWLARQTVNLLPYGLGGSSPSAPTNLRSN